MTGRRAKYVARQQRRDRLAALPTPEFCMRWPGCTARTTPSNYFPGEYS
jgi:hypothetical protein